MKFSGIRNLGQSVMAGWLAVLFVALPGLASETIHVIPAGSTLHVSLMTTLTDKTNKTGDRFIGQLTQPVIANGKEIVPQGSTVEGHIAFLKPSGRIKGVAQMRLIIDDVVTPDNVRYTLAASLEDARGGPCANSPRDEEGTIKGCGKSKGEYGKNAAIAGAVGAGAGASVGLGHEIDCEYFGNCGGPGFGTDVMYGAAAGGATALLYTLLKHEKHIVLVQGTQLTFVVNRTATATAEGAGAAAPNDSPPRPLAGSKDKQR